MTPLPTRWCDQAELQQTAHGSLELQELPALQWTHDFCATHPDSLVWYIHRYRLAVCSCCVNQVHSGGFALNCVGREAMVGFCLSARASATATIIFSLREWPTGAISWNTVLANSLALTDVVDDGGLECLG